MRRMLLLGVVLLAACSWFKSDPSDKVIPRADLRNLSDQFNTALAGDSELAPVFGPFKTTGTRRPDTEPFGFLTVNRKTRGELSRSDRERLVKKAAGVFTGLFLNSPVRAAETATVYLADRGSDLGWFHARAGQADYLYKISGQ
jgi:hypothetical protein